MKLRNYFDDLAVPSDLPLSDDEKNLKNGFCRWSAADNGVFLPSNQTMQEIPAGLYEIGSSQTLGLFFKTIKPSEEELIKFDDTHCDEVVNDIRKFWTLRDAYASMQQAYKRGFLLIGVPGGGKSSAIKLIVKDVIELGGIAIKFQNPDYFKDGMSTLRRIEPNRPIVVLMEDIDGLLEDWSESDILNILDGVTNYENIVFLATTNHPDKLLGSVTNRPSRFDRVLEFKAPNKKTRETYLSHLNKKFSEANKEETGLNVEKMVADTEGFTIAHLKELFISVAIFKYEYESCVNKLKGMADPIKPDLGMKEKVVGF